MKTKRISRTLTLAVIALTTALVSGAGASPKMQFTVKSSLDGRTALPHRIHWLAFPSLAASRVARVDFFVDGGRARWTERRAPYSYADDGAYLVTSWLLPGKHRFEVRATAKDGRTATDTVVATVMPAPAPTADIAGTWRRMIDTTGAPKVGSKANPGTYTPSGVYRLTFEKRWMRDQFPGTFVYPASNTTGNGFIFLSDYAVTPTLLHVHNEVIFHPVSDKLAEGGWWCHEYGGDADYRWTTSGATLTLTPIGADSCGIRGFIWTGEWTRAG
jgi:hypothetical protein